MGNILSDKTPTLHFGKTLCIQDMMERHFWLSHKRNLIYTRAVLLSFLCSLAPDEIVDIYVPRKIQNLQTGTQRRSRKRLLLFRPALQFSHCVKCWQSLFIICGIICILYPRPACTHFLYPSQLSLPHTHKRSLSVGGQGHVFPR